MTHLPIIKILNNCDELIKFACEELSSCNTSSTKAIEAIEFQGDECEIARITCDYLEEGFVYKDFFMSLGNSTDVDFCIIAVKGRIDFDKQYNCVVLPNYVRSELIATIKGEW